MSLVYAPGATVQSHSKDGALHSIPIIDFSHLHQNQQARSHAIKDIGNACKTWGCFQVINHGINTTVINDALEAGFGFFGLSAEERPQFASNDISKPVRYEASSKDGIRKRRDLLKLYAHPLREWIHLWPLTPQGYREKMGNYVLKERRVTLQLLEATLQSLGIDQSYQGDQFDNGMQHVATNFYPKRTKQTLEVGFDSHSDYGFITALIQSCPGLQVKDQEKEAWREIPQLPHALHVHIGDYMEVVSNGRYRSLIHRAILNSEAERISIASIHNLSMDEKVAPAKEMVDDLNPIGYKENSFRNFLSYLSIERKNEKRYIEDLKISGD